MALEETNIGKSTIGGNPTRALSLQIADNSVSTPKIQDLAVTTAKINYKAVTPDRLSDSVSTQVVKPQVDAAKELLNANIQNLANKELRDIENVRNDYNTKINSLDTKHTKNYSNLQKQITDNQREYSKNRSEDLKMLQDRDKDLQNQIASLQVGGIALSNQFGNSEDIGITQKALTRMLGALWDTIESLHPGHVVFDFILTVNPQYIFNEIVEDNVSVKADCTSAISDFDSVKVYVDDELRVESEGIRVFETSVIVTKTSTIKVVGTILGKEIVKTALVINEIPFFMGGGMEYTDIMNEECRKELVGSLEGEYDATISTTGQYLFVIIPISRKEEFRRCKMDMNGFEIPIETTEMTDYIVCKSLNTYKADTYNIDIDINS